MRAWTMARLVAGLGSLVAARRWLRRQRRIDYANKVVAITGGSRGLGLVLARELLHRDARVAICARDEAELERAREELAGIGEVIAVVADVTVRDDVLRFATEVRDRLGPVDVWINNAGVIQVAAAELMTGDDYAQALATHLWAPLHAAQLIAPEMRRRRFGRIVNIASIGGRMAVPHMAPYAASKAALVGLSRALRSELAADSVYVTTVCPGLLRTGSARHAQVRGNHRAEYAWFAIADSLPGLSTGAERAARQILDAAAHGDAELVIGLSAKVAALAVGIAPGLVHDALAVVNRLLPRADLAHREARRGADSESVLAPSVLTRLSDDAAERNNEL